MRAFPLVMLATILLAGAARAQNLLQNGSFESPDVPAGTAQVFPGSIPGWTDTSFCGIEIQDNCCGSPSDGAQHVELDSNCSSTIDQTVATQPGAHYVVSFDFSPRPGENYNELIVSWNGGQIFDEIKTGSAAQETQWTHYAIAVAATGTSSTVEFSDGGSSSNGAGTYIDNLPEPGRSAQLLAGLLMIAGLARCRRRSALSRGIGL
jgi:hypothetical protein